MRACDNVRKEENNKDGNAVLLFTQDDPEQNQQTSKKKLLVEAIRNNLFHLMFQPLFSLQGEEAEHYETYLRLKFPIAPKCLRASFSPTPISATTSNAKSTAGHHQHHQAAY